MAQSENSKRTSSNRGGGPGGRQGGFPQRRGGQDYDYSGGNLKYGTGKYTQRENDGYQGGVNISKNGRSMQDSVYREDRQNVDRARGRPRGGDDFGSRMDEIEDMERGMGGGMHMGGAPQEGMRDRMMRNRGGRNGNMDGDIYDMDDDEYGSGARDRMGGGGLLRDLQDAGGRNRDGYDDFGSRGGNYLNSGGKVMGGSSKGRAGGYRSSQFQADLINERRRYETYGFRMEDYMDDGFMDEAERRMRMNGNGNGPRRSGASASNFDRRRGGGGGGDFYHDDYDGMESYRYSRGGGGVGGVGGGGMETTYRQGSRGMEMGSRVMGSNGVGVGMDSFRQGSRGMNHGSRRGGRGGRYYDEYDGYGDYDDDYGEDYRGGGGDGGGGLLRDMRR